MAVQKLKLSYSRIEAAEATGLSPASIKRACDAGDLRETHPMINGRPSAKGVIAHDELSRWIGAQA